VVNLDSTTISTPLELPSSPAASRFGCNTLLYTTTDDELGELLAAAKELNLPSQPIERRPVTYYDLGRVGDRIVYAVKTDKTSLGPHGFGGSAARSIYCQMETEATSIIVLGMAFGIDSSNQKYGDVLVSSELLPYDNRDVTSDGGLPRYNFERVKPHRAMETLRLLFVREQRQPRPYKVHVGALLSGAARIHCRAYRDHLVARCKSTNKETDPIIGGEMEGVGFLSLSDPLEPRWIVVKGIIDFADEERDKVYKGNRKTACRNAAEFVLSSLLREHDVVEAI